MDAGTVTVALRERDRYSTVVIKNVSDVQLESSQDDQGRAVWHYSLTNAEEEEIAAFPFDAVAGWWRADDSAVVPGATSS
jgi:hypothetical protein